MLALALPSGPLRLLCLGAHADDIEIGCGGTVLRLLAEHPGSSCCWAVFSGDEVREREARDGAEHFLSAATERQVHVKQFRDGHFPMALTGIKEALGAIRRDVTPDLVFTHFRDDRHQDHRTMSDATWQTFRDHAILEYEVPKYDGDLGQPNCFVPLGADVRKRKIAGLLAAFPSQRTKRWFTEETFVAILRLRGIESGASEGFAEAFYARKLTIDARSGGGTAHAARPT